MSGGAFVGEAEAYGILQRSGIRPPRHAFATDPAPFSPGDPVVLKGLGEGLWHKSELGAVAFVGYEGAAVGRLAGEMRGRVEGAGHRWIGALVCEKVACARSEGLPSEAFVSLTRNETGWIALFGCGGLQAEALSQHAGVLRWPVGLMSPAQAMAELRGHLVGRVWLGRLRGAKALTDEARLGRFLGGLWRLADLAEAEGLSLLEMNPVALDSEGDPRPLDAVGRRDPRPPVRIPPPAGFLDAVRAPRRVALAGVSSREDGVGRIILENLRRCAALEGGLTLIKPGQDILLGLPCVPSVAALRDRPVDLLILAIPAPAAAKAVSELIAQGGGARVVALVPGGLGDGADTEGLGAALAAELRSSRAAGRWTPAILGPNFLGHWVPEIDLDTSFIPQEKLPPMHPEGGSLALLGQSGAFLLCRRSRHRNLRLLLGAALGNELDVALPDYLEGLASDPRCLAVAAYAEGFRPGALDATLYAAMRLRERGVPFLLHRAGRTAAGQAAAASHTGAMAGEVEVERAVLSRAGVRFSDSITAFDAALAWLASYPRIPHGPVAILSNAGFECVSGNDAIGPRPGPARLEPDTVQALREMLAAEGLAGLVAPRLPLDLTPMASESAYLRAAQILLRRDAGSLILGAVPFTRRLHTDGAVGREFAGMLAELSGSLGKPIGIAVDAGAGYEAYRDSFADAGLPVFRSLEEALLGLQTLAG